MKNPTKPLPECVGAVGCSVLLGIIFSLVRSTFRVTKFACGVRIGGTHNSSNLSETFSGQEASQLRLLCRDKSGDLMPVPLRPALSADTSSNMNMPLHKLKIEVHILPTIALWLTSLAVSLLLTVLSGELRQFQWLLLATLSGSLLESFRIVFGGTLSCVLMPNVQSSATATGGSASNGTIIIEFHISVKTQGVVAVGCSDLLGVLLFNDSIASRFVAISQANDSINRG